jgi:long-chain acyl-CoA synthetase
VKIEGKMVEDAWLSGLTDHTLPQILVKQAERMGKNWTALREKAYGIWQTFSWDDYLRYVRHTALGFDTIGLKRGEHLGIIMNNHSEWLFSELGCQSVGAVSLNLFTSAIPDELATSLHRIQAAYVVAQDQEQVDKLIEIRSKIPHVRKVIYVDPTGMRIYKGDSWLISFCDLLMDGERKDRQHPELFPKVVAAGNPNDMALMIQTSGTTGLSKLAMLTHRNALAMARTWLTGVSVCRGDNWVSLSPPAWIVDQMWCLGVAIAGGITINFPETPETVIDDFREIGPTMIITASRFWEDLASKIRVKMSESGAVKRNIFDMAERIGHRVVAYHSRREPVPRHLKKAHALAGWIVYKPLLDRVGCSRLRSAYTGGHPISPDVIRFFHAIGLNLKQC